MELLIDDTSTIQEIQQEFNAQYPNLKIEFFHQDDSHHKLFCRLNLITDTHKKLKEIRHIHQKGQISINGHQKVSTLERHFKELLGVNIQVFRKSGKSWLQTTATDEWTLAEQNKKGEEMNHEIPEETTTENDIHEQL
jgi:hypothetical protein